MARKTVRYNPAGIAELPNNRPVKYTIQTDSGNPNYIGTAKRGRVRARISEHLGEIPGTKVRIEPFGSIKEAEENEARSIRKLQPRYNKKEK